MSYMVNVSQVPEFVCKQLRKTVITWLAFLVMGVTTLLPKPFKLFSETLISEY